MKLKITPLVEVKPLIQKATGRVVSYVAWVDGHMYCFGKTHKEALDNAFALLDADKLAPQPIGHAPLDTPEVKRLQVTSSDKERQLTLFWTRTGASLAAL